MVPAGPLPSVTVRPALDADVDPMAAQLSRSFFDDPVAGHIFRNERRRPVGLRRFFTIQLRGDYLPFGGCYTTDDHRGAAVWAPPGKPRLTGLAGIASLVRVIPYVSNVRATLRLLNLMESIHPPEPHWYLATLGTDPADQGHGIGSALMRPVLDHCDTAGVPAYLEVVQGAQRPLLPPPRLRGRRRGCPPRRRAEYLDHVASTPEPLVGVDLVLGVDPFGHGQRVTHHQPQHVDHGPHRRRGQAAPALGDADPASGKPSSGTMA